MRIAAFITTVSLLLAGMGAAKTLVYNCRDTPQICLNGCWAVNCARARHPRVLNGGGAPNSKASGKRAMENRKAWGYSSAHPCKKGRKWAWTAPRITGGRHMRKYNANRQAHSPEEYPYASSLQGGIKWAGKPVALRCVPILEQNIQGGIASGIGTLSQKEKIRIRYTNLGKMPKKSPNWCSRRPKCQNDGHQFTAIRKGVYKAGKTRRDLLDGPDGNSTIVDDIFDGPLDDVEFVDDVAHDNITPGLQVSPDGDSATISARWTEDGLVPDENDDDFDGESGDDVDVEETETQTDGESRVDDE